MTCFFSLWQIGKVHIIPLDYSLTCLLLHPTPIISLLCSPSPSLLLHVHFQGHAAMSPDPSLGHIVAVPPSASYLPALSPISQELRKAFNLQSTAGTHFSGKALVAGMGHKAK